MTQQISQQTDVLILGSGVAGCVAAYTLAKKGVNVVLVTNNDDPSTGTSASDYEGIATCAEGETADQFARDLNKAGAGRSSRRSIDHLVNEGPKVVRELLVDELGVRFDASADGTLTCFQDSGHSTPRLLRVGDGTGHAVVHALLEKLQQLPNVYFLTNHSAIELITLDQHSAKHDDLYKKPTCLGAYLANSQTGQVTTCLAKETILATGGFGQLFLHTTNAATSRGDGLAMAHRAGARTLNLDTVQFHALTFSVPNGRPRRLPDALREYGAEILTHRCAPFMEKHHELGSKAPRQLVALAAYRELTDSEGDNLWLDLRRSDLAGIQAQHGHLFSICSEHGIDPAKDLIPIVPAAHCCNGGVSVDQTGQTTLQRLRAIGEVACTGVHGEERLPGVALLESVVWGSSCAQDIARDVEKFAYYQPPVKEWKHGEVVNEGLDSVGLRQDWDAVQQTMWNYAGMVTDQRHRRRARVLLQDLQWDLDERIAETSASAKLWELRNGVSAALLVAAR